VEVPADIVDVAEHLCLVEHTDHRRFTSEPHFPEILSLYALNQGNTFRYSVSSAGAGGMIQMIPRTYEMIRQQQRQLRHDTMRGRLNGSRFWRVFLQRQMSVSARNTGSMLSECVAMKIR